jgi:hypothetical protein
MPPKFNYLNLFGDDPQLQVQDGWVSLLGRWLVQDDQPQLLVPTVWPRNLRTKIRMTYIDWQTVGPGRLGQPARPPARPGRSVPASRPDCPAE